MSFFLLQLLPPASARNRCNNALPGHSPLPSLRGSAPSWLWLRRGARTPGTPPLWALAACVLRRGAAVPPPPPGQPSRPASQALPLVGFPPTAPHPPALLPRRQPQQRGPRGPSALQPSHAPGDSQVQPRQVQPQVPNCRILNLALSPSSKFSDPPLPAPVRPRVQLPARIKVRPPCDSTPDFPPGAPVPGAATYPGRGPGAAAGSWRCCPGRPGPSTPRCGAGQPLDEFPTSSCAPFPGHGRPRGCLETNPGASRKRNYSGWHPGSRAAKHPGPAGGWSESVAGRREPPIYPCSFCTHPTNEARDFVVGASTMFPPKLPHTHTHTLGPIRAALGPAHPLPLLGCT